MAEGASRTVRQAQQADWEEDSLLRLYLTTLAGTVIQLQVPVSIYHTWEMLEEYLVEHLPCISPIETFGCELTLLNADTQVALQDPVQEELWNTNHFCLIVHECFRSLENNKPLQGLDYEDCPKAIRVPVSESGILEAKAFHSTTRVRHACLDVGFSAISPQAWRYCHSLRIVKLPDTVVTLGYAAFQGCYSLQVAEMPGCVEFGVRVFSECCALESVGNIVDGGSHLAIGAIISQYAFEECAKLAHLSLPHVRAVVDSSALTSPQAGLPQGCFFASGVQQVELGEDTYHIGHRALENCKALTRVNLANTGIHTLHMHTFAQCHSLETIRLPNCLREIRAEVFVGCKALERLTLPGSIRYLGYRAFGDCTELFSLEYAWSKQEAWRYPYAADNAFEGCIKLTIPKWLHRIPPKDSDWIAPCS